MNERLCELADAAYNYGRSEPARAVPLWTHECGAFQSRIRIAELLPVSDKTVSTYKARILEKRQLKTTAELIRYAIENTLLD